MKPKFEIWEYSRKVPGGPWFALQGFALHAPQEVRVSLPIRTDYKERCAYILEGHTRHGVRDGFTGLLRTQYKDTYSGDFRLKCGTSFLVAILRPEGLDLIVAPGYRVFPRSRSKRIEEALQTIRARQYEQPRP